MKKKYDVAMKGQVLQGKKDNKHVERPIIRILRAKTTDLGRYNRMIFPTPGMSSF